MIITIIFLFLFSLIPKPAFATFALDTSAQSNRNASNPKTLAYTNGSDAKLLVLCVEGNPNTDRTGGDPTYNGVPMIQAQSTQLAGGLEVMSEIWYLPNPDTGSSHTISVPNTGGNTLRLMAASFSTTNTQTNFDTGSQSGVTVANPSLTVETQEDGEVVVNCFSSGRSSRPAGNNQTLLFSNDEGAWNTNMQYAIQDVAGSITFSWTIASDDVANILAAFLEGTTVVTGGSKITNGLLQ